MALVVPNSANLIMLGLITNFETADGSVPNTEGDRILKLFKNDIVPSKTTTIGSLEEIDSEYFSSDYPILLPNADWEISILDGVCTATYPSREFVLEQSTLVYGYFVTTGDDELLWAERFTTAPFSLPSSGGVITVTLNFTIN